MQRRRQRPVGLLAALVDASGDAIVSSDAQERFTTWNPAAERLFGYTASEAIGQPATLTVPPEFDDQRRNALRQVAATETARSFETKRRHKDGTLIDVEMKITAIHDAAGTVVGYVNIIRDIRERKAAEAALAASELQLRTVFEHAPIGMALVSPDLRILQANHALCSMLGYSEAELTSSTIAAITHPDDTGDDLAPAKWTRRAEVDLFDREKRYVRKDGQLVWGHLRVSVVRDDGGVPRYLISQIQDITERKAAEAAQVATQQSIWDVLGRIAESFYALDRAWRFTYVNAAAELIFGRSGEQLVGVSIWEAFPGARETPLYTAVHRAVAEGSIESFDYFHPPSASWFEGRAYPSPGGVSVFVRDVTEQRRAEAATAAALAQLQAANRELEQLSAAKSDFVSTISHEFRTPLTSIQGYSELIVTEAESLAEARAFAQTINQNALRLARMVNDVLDLDALEAGQRAVRQDAVDLNHLVACVLEAMQAMLAGHRLVSELAPSLPPLRGDADLLERVITNLVANALKYSPAGSSITVTTGTEHGEVELTVADQGLGVPAEHRETIFSRYGRISRPEQIGIQGTGLGLPIVRHIVETHRGRVWVDDNTPRGSIFHVVLPAADPASSPDEAAGQRD